MQQQISTSNLTGGQITQISQVQICKKMGLGLIQQQIRTSNLLKTGGKKTEISQQNLGGFAMRDFILVNRYNSFKIAH